MLRFIFIVEQLPPTEHTARAAFQRHNRLALDHSIVLQLLAKKASQTVSRALSSFEQSEWHKGALEICPTCQAPPEPVPAAVTPAHKGRPTEEKTRPSFFIIHMWLLEAICDYRKPSLLHLLRGTKWPGSCNGLTVLCSGTSLASAWDRTKLLVSLKLPPFLTWVKQSKKIKLIII